jgi:DNA polymerase theta
VERLVAVVIDELHLMGEEMRGYLLEIILAKIHFINMKQRTAAIQIIAMSATLPNLPQIGAWLDAELFTTDFRPVAIAEYVSMPYRK